MLQEILDKGLLAEQELRKDRVRSGKFNSSNFGRCYRLQVLDRLNIQPTNPPDIYGLRKMKVGQDLHKTIQEFFPSSQREVQYMDDDFIHISDIITKEYVMEIKTMSDFAWKWTKKQDFSLEFNKRNNILQLMSGCYFHKKDVGVLAFVNTGSYLIDEYPIMLDHWEEDIMKELSNLKRYWITFTLPKAEPVAFPSKDKDKVVYKDCEYCSFKDLCKNYNQEEEVSDSWTTIIQKLQSCRDSLLKTLNGQENINNAENPTQTQE